MENPQKRALDYALLEKALLEQGFAQVGVVDYEQAIPLLQPHFERYRDWIRRGLHGEMGYLERGQDRRLNPKLVFSDLKSVITVMLPYDSRAVEVEGVRYSRYLNGPDYHDDLKDRMQRALAPFREQMSYKICVDTSAVLERSWAALTGLGWIGKNTMLIHPQWGSYFFIGVIFTDQSFGRAPQLLKDYCGHCTRCLDACPTQAFLRPHDLDARRCVSYLTLEKRGPWSGAIHEQVAQSGFVAGCDICQEVCPYNTKAVRNAQDQWGPFQLNPTLALGRDRLQSETLEEYQSRIQKSALSRIKFEDFKRNLSSLLETRKKQ